MLIYNILVIILFATFFFSLNDSKLKIINKLSIIIWMLLWFFAANHSLNVGTDTISYYNQFRFIEHEAQESYNQGLQRGWFFYNYFFFKYFGYDAFMYTCYFIAFGGLLIFIRKYSPNYVLSLLLFFLLYFYCQSLNIMRQYIALGLILFAYTYYWEKRINLICCIFIASTLHYSAILLLPFCFIDKIKLSSKLVYALIISSFVLGFFLQNLSSQIMKSFLFLGGLNEGVEFYLTNSGGERNIFSNLVINIMFIYTYLLSKNKDDKYLLLYMFFILFKNMFGASGQANRIFIYFQIVSIIVVPQVYYQIKTLNIIKANTYLLFYLIYSFIFYIKSISANFAEVVPYSLR